MKIQKICSVNIVVILLFIAVQLLIKYVPNSSDRLASVQESYSVNGKSKIDNEWAYYLINDEFPLDQNYTPELAQVQGTFMMDERCADYAKAMLEAAAEDGIKLTVVSAYRSIQKQTENLEAYTQRLIDEGMSEDEAQAAALKEIAEPGTSEHNAGLALDILTENWWLTHDDVTADFENTEEFLWLSANAHKYGFIMRYPEEWEHVTKYTYEPWHYRFVGVYYAAEIKESGLPLEYYYKMNF